MKAFKERKRTLLKMVGRVRWLKTMLADKVADALNQQLKLKNSEIAIKFNSPSHPETELDISLNLGGPDLVNRFNELDAKFQSSPQSDSVFVETQISLQTPTANHLSALFNNCVSKLSLFLPFKPVALATNPNEISIGFCIPNKVGQLDPKLREQLVLNGQSVHFSIALGMSLARLMEDGGSLGELVKGGFSIKVRT